MSRKSICAAILFAVMIGLCSAFVFAQNPGKFCQVWKNEQVRCGFGQEFMTYKATVTVKNLKPGTAKLSTGEWHSLCGWPGVNVQNLSRALRGGETVTFTLNPVATQNTCREIFFQCEGKCSEIFEIRGDANAH